MIRHVYMGRSTTLRIGATTLLALAAVLYGASSAYCAEQAFIIAPPDVDEPSSSSHQEIAVLAGGCFWGVQGVFQHVKGVSQALSGYVGGNADTAHYDNVSMGDTGHAEAVQITYDPTEITYGQLLQIYFSVAHDPTQKNRQGPDTGSQYRSTIFATKSQQHKIAQAYIEQLGKSGVYRKPIVTTIEDQKNFYPAEPYHQDYLVKHPDSLYIVFNDMPKIANLAKEFGERYRDKPVLVNR